MNPPDRNPTERILGTMYERDDLLLQRARNGRPARWVRTIARVTFVLLLLALVPFLLAGPYGAIGWAGTYLVPVVVVSLVLGCAFGPLVWVALKLDRWGQEIH